MKPRRIHLVEFLMARRRRPARHEKALWRSGQMDLPGLPCYGRPERAEIEAHIHTSETLIAPSSARPARHWPALLPIVPLALFVPATMLGVDPRIWVPALLVCITLRKIIE